jgi:uncharacterized protein (DUF342 family)
VSSPRDKRSVESLDDIYREAIRTPEVQSGYVQGELSEDFLSGDVYSPENSADDRYGQVVMHSLAAKNPAWYGKEIAIAADKMRVTVKVRGGKSIDTYTLNHGLEQLGVSYGVNLQSLRAAEECSKFGNQGEFVVAVGTAAEPRLGVIFPVVQRGISLDGSFFLLADGIKLDGPGVRALLSTETLERIEKNTLLVRAVAAGTTLARIYQNPDAKSGTNVMGDIIDPVDDIPPECGDNVCRNAKEGTVEASRYGYLVLEGNTISVLPPVWVSPDRLGAYYVNCTQIGPPVYPSGNDLADSLSSLNISKKAIRLGIIDKLVERLGQGELLSAKTVKIAEAKVSRPGRNASFVFCKELGSKADTILSDGMIDLQERNAVVGIKTGTLIAEKTIATKGISGADLFDNTIAAEDGLDLEVLFDDVVRTEERGEKISYYAQKDGNLRFAQNRLTIADIYPVAGNVDSSTGNLDQQEDIQISGSVMAGFTVRSQGNIAIAGSIYNGAKVMAGGDISVGEGIIGVETRVVALGNLRAFFIQDAEVLVKGDALIRSYLHNAVLRVNGTITVVDNPLYGHKSGRIIGGLTCASRRIVVSRVGLPEQADTVLAIQPDPEYSGQMKKLEDESRNCREGIARISRTLPFKNFDSTSIKKILAQLPKEKSDPIIKLLTNLNSLIKRQQNIDALSKEISSKMRSSLRNGTIQILQEICQGSELQFGDKRLVISADQTGATFRLQGGEIV